MPTKNSFGSLRHSRLRISYPRLSLSCVTRFLSGMGKNFVEMQFSLEILPRLRCLWNAEREPDCNLCHLRRIEFRIGKARGYRFAHGRPNDKHEVMSVFLRDHFRPAQHASVYVIEFELQPRAQVPSDHDVSFGSSACHKHRVRKITGAGKRYIYSRGPFFDSLEISNRRKRDLCIDFSPCRAAYGCYPVSRDCPVGNGVEQDLSFWQA